MFTWTEEDDGFEVGILIAVCLQLGHTVTELLQLPDVLHHRLYSFTRQLVFKS